MVINGLQIRSKYQLADNVQYKVSANISGIIVKQIIMYYTTLLKRRMRF